MAKPDPILAEALKRQVGQPGAFGDADPILTPRPRSMPEFQTSQLSARRIRGKRGQPAPVNIVKPQLGPRVGALPADDDPHPVRPEDTGEFGDIGTLTRLTGGAIGWLPRVQLRELTVEVGHRRRQHPTDRIRQTTRGQKAQEVMGAAGGISADEYLLARRCFTTGKTGENILDQSDVIGRGVRSGIAWPQPGLPRSMNASRG